MRYLLVTSDALHGHRADDYATRREAEEVEYARRLAILEWDGSDDGMQSYIISFNPCDNFVAHISVKDGNIRAEGV